MDEVDIDGEDFNELEARLYGQIHHEAVEPRTVDVNNTTESQVQGKVSLERIVTEKSVVNRPARTHRVPDTRYWANSLKTSKPTNKPSQTKYAATMSNDVNLNGNITDNEKLSKNVTLETKESGARTSENNVEYSSKNQSQLLNNDKVKKSEQLQKSETNNTTGNNLLINPSAVVKNSRQNLKKKKQEHVQRNGPFMQKETKLQKALLLQAKKKKSENVRNKNLKQKPEVVSIVLDSSSDGDSGTNNTDDDVVLIPAKPPPTITLSDSDTDCSAFQLEENAMDSCDVVLDNKISKSTGFTKPNEVRSNVTKDTSSRCTSPCSVLSSDDFIGQTDRSRLLENSCIADDQDLALLTADVDSVRQPPMSQSNNLKEANPEAKNSASDEVLCTAEFTAPLSTSTIPAVTENNYTLQNQNKQGKNYSVDQTEFRAMDVYESESDITDNVYSKGTNRVRTIINAVDSSSEEDDVQQISSNQKVKRFCKRRTSSSNRGSDVHNDDPSTDDEMDEGVTKTSVPFILRGNAVERNNKKVRKCIKPLNSRRVSVSGVGNVPGNMSDTQFIATLNSLVQGRENDPNNVTDEQKDEQDNSGDDVQPNNNQCNTVTQEKLPSPIISEQESLQSVELVERPTLPESLSQAVPDDAVTGMDKIFASIDNMADTTEDKNENYYEYSSGDEVEVIQPPVQISTDPEQIENERTLPIRHIAYNEQNLQLSGLGWNEEMVKFYNFSWHGERFTLVGLQNGMQRDPKLWKIYSEDRFPKSRPYSNLKCYNCCEFGHIRSKCRRPKKPPICYMCGESGHFEPRCPNTICLRCGNKTQVFTKSCNACTFQNRLICPICKVRGHTINLCPDKWRRYHSTTQPNAHPNSEIVFNKRKMCCVCGANGHFSDTCRSALRFMQYPVIVSHVKSHQKSYSDLLLKSPHTGIALNLLYRPRDEAVFHMAEKTTPNGYYGRFLKAVGLGNMLRRKRPSKCLAAPEKPSKQARSLSEHCEPNTLSTTDNVDNRNIAPEPELAPNQVQEVSGSVILAEAVTSDALDVCSEEVMNIECTNKTSENDINNVKWVDVDKSVANSSNEFKAPSDAPTSTISHQLSQNKDNLTVDSDSNYSFSDHFAMPLDDVMSKGEMISEESALDVRPSTSAAAKSMLKGKSVREMDPLPDFIPLMDSSDVNTDDMDKNFDTEIGISKCFVSADTDNENENEDNEAEKHDSPCEAKIYLTHFHSNYLLTPDGHEFLVQKSKDCNITARLDWTSVGHVLVIFGLPSDQDTFHKALIQKCHELMDQMNKTHLISIKVPKRIDALIRFLRENISQLQSDLGDVNELQKRIMNLEKSHTKANMKLADKFRRLLNMILLGQAGLCDGDKYLKKLLVNLKSLINDYQAQNMVPQALREEIDSHSKMIFTSYRHENYPELIQTYNRMSKSRKLNLNIDPLLLGGKMLDVILTAEQRARLEQPQSATASELQSIQTPSAKESTDNVSNSPSLNNSKLINMQKDLRQPSQPQSKQSHQSLSKSKNSTPNSTPTQSLSEIISTRAKSSGSTPTKRHTVATPPFINPQQKSTVASKVKESVQNRQSALDNILHYDISPSAGDNFKIQMQSPSGTGNTKRGPSKGPSVFWSRESMRYLDECIQMAESNTELLLKLQRIQTKAEEGALSYNDYRAVIKLHGAMVGY